MLAVLVVTDGFFVMFLGELCLNSRFVATLRPQFFGLFVGAMVGVLSAAAIILCSLAIFGLVPVTKAGPLGEPVFGGGLFLGLALYRLLRRFWARRSEDRAETE